MEYQGLDFIDLISERHLYLRSLIEQQWNAKFDVKINTTEWHILAKLYRGATSIAIIAKGVHVSRQATHKLIKGLEDKQLVNIFDDASNKKIKKVQLTQLGVEYYEQYLIIKSNIEQSIVDVIGAKELALIKASLNKNW